MSAVYRLSDQLACFDFFYWLVMVKAKGATEIVFDTSHPKTNKGFAKDEIMARFETIIAPGPALASLPCRVGSAKPRVEAVARDFNSWTRLNQQFERLRTVKPATPCKYTVTIRENDKAKGRNSNPEAWRRFAATVGAVLIEDYRNAPIHLHDRVALYAGAEMNFGVCNGPVSLISLTPYPVTQFVNSDSARNNIMRWGVQEGANLPYQLSNQRLVWQEDSFDNLCRVFEQ